MKTQLDVILSVDWEGTSLERENLQGIQEFKKSTGLPIVHYMNPAYQTHPDNLGHSLYKAVEHCLFDNDELGLHLHVPQHFVAAAGVLARTSPTFSASGDQHSGSLQGQEVMLHSYSGAELKQMIGLSLAIFKSWGLNGVRSFRAGGWMVSEEQLKILSDLNFVVDSSAVPARVLEGSCWYSDSLRRYVDILWDDITLESQPYNYSWSDTFLEIPNNLGAIDYWSTTQQQNYLQSALSQAFHKGQHTVVVTAHQETFSQYRPRLESFINQLSTENDVSLNFVTNQYVYEKQGLFCSEPLWNVNQAGAIRSFRHS